MPVVAYVGRVHLPVAGQQRADQPDGRLGVERAAPLPEQRRLGVQRRVGVHLQQCRLDLGDLLPARLRPALPRTTSSCA